MKNKGQALVEFIIILPILIIIMLGIIDFCMLFSKKNNLENTLDDVAMIWKESSTKESVDNFLKDIDENITFEYVKGEDTIRLILKEKYEVITPGLNKILSNPYIVKVSRVIYNEK